MLNRLSFLERLKQFNKKPQMIIIISDDHFHKGYFLYLFRFAAKTIKSL